MSAKPPLDARLNQDPRSFWRSWPKLLPFMITVLLVLLLGYMVIEALYRFGQVIEPVMIPLLISVALAYLFEPLVDRLQQYRFSRPTAALFTILIAGLSFTLLLLFLVPSFWFQLTDIFVKLPVAVKSAAAWARPNLAYLQDRSPVLYEKISDLINDFIQDPSRITEPIVGFVKRAVLQLGGITASVLNLILIPLFVYYILADFPRLRAICHQAVPPRHRGVTTELFQQVDGVLRNFVRGQLLVCLAMAVLYVIGFLILGVPMGFTLGILSGFGHLVPYFGTASAAILVLTLTGFSSPEWWRLLAVLLMYPIVQSIEGFVLTPRILGEKLELHPFIVLVGIILGHHLFGILGIVLAAPVMACAKIFIGFFYNRYLQSDYYQRPGEIIPVETATTPVEPEIVAASHD